MRALCLGLAAALALALPAAAFTLTGTWQGTQKCKGVDFGGPNASFAIGDPIEITQTGDDVAMRVVFTGGQDDYVGLKIDGLQNADQGRLYLVRCGTNDTPGTLVDTAWDETVDLTVKTKASGSGKLKGLSTFIDIEGIGNCKWSYKRVDTADPGVVAACPAMP